MQMVRSGKGERVLPAQRGGRPNHLHHLRLQDLLLNPRPRPQVLCLLYQAQRSPVHHLECRRQKFSHQLPPCGHLRPRFPILAIQKQLLGLSSRAQLQPAPHTTTLLVQDAGLAPMHIVRTVSTEPVATRTATPSAGRAPTRPQGPTTPIPAPTTATTAPGATARSSTARAAARTSGRAPTPTSAPGRGAAPTPRACSPAPPPRWRSPSPSACRSTCPSSPTATRACTR
mmetsp:Transcript_85721/g.228510  ORF Transcript_85721/g.228510 Transcript_85721/m.228510 type:complete len:229 (-) Transcript_85721:102-788(-)